MLETLKRILFPSRTDRVVKKYNDESEAMLKEAARVAKSHRDLLRKNGVALQIYIATGGDKHGH